MMTPYVLLHHIAPSFSHRHSPPLQGLRGQIFFNVPHFSYDAELKLEQADAAFREKGTLLIPDPKLKSDIPEGLIQAIVQHKVYVTDREFDQVAEALIKRHPCLQERGSATGYGG